MNYEYSNDLKIELEKEIEWFKKAIESGKNPNAPSIKLSDDLIAEYKNDLSVYEKVISAIKNSDYDSISDEIIALAEGEYEASMNIQHYAGGLAEEIGI